MPLEDVPPNIKGQKDVQPPDETLTSGTSKGPGRTGKQRQPGLHRLQSEPAAQRNGTQASVRPKSLIGQDLRQENPVLPSRIPHRNGIDPGVSVHSNIVTWSSSSPQESRRPRQHEWTNGSQQSFSRGSRSFVPYRNESMVMMQSMPGAFPDADWGPVSYSSSFRAPYQYSENSSNLSLGSLTPPEMTPAQRRSTTRPPFHGRPGPSRSSFRAPSPAQGESSPHRSVGSRIIVPPRANTGQGFPFAGPPMPRRPPYPGPLPSYGRSNVPRPPRNNWPPQSHRDAPPSGNGFPITYSQQGTPQSMPNFPNANISYSENSIGPVREEPPRFYDYSEGFEDRFRGRNLSLESLIMIGKERPIPENQPLVARKQVGENGEVDFQSKNARVTTGKAEASKPMAVNGLKRDVDDATSQDHSSSSVDELKDEIRGMRRHPVLGNHSTNSEKAPKKESEKPKPKALKRRSTVSYASAKSFKSSFYSRDQSRDDLSMIASLYGSSKPLGDLHATQQDRSESPSNNTQRSSLGSLGNRLSSRLSWHQGRFSYDLSKIATGALDSEKVTIKPQRPIIARRKSSGYIRISHDENGEFNGEIKSDPSTNLNGELKEVQPSTRKSADKYVRAPERRSSRGLFGSSSKKPAGQDPLGPIDPTRNKSSQSSLVPLSVPITPERPSPNRPISVSLLSTEVGASSPSFTARPTSPASLQLFTSHPHPTLDGRKIHPSLPFRGLEADTSGDVEDSFDRAPSPSRPWTLAENYPWTQSNENFTITPPATLGPLPPTPSRRPRFKLRLLRPSTSTAGSTTLESLSLGGSPNGASSGSAYPFESPTQQKSQHSSTPPPPHRLDLLSSLKARFARQPLSEPSLSALIPDNPHPPTSSQPRSNLRLSLPPLLDAPSSQDTHLRVPPRSHPPVQVFIPEVDLRPPTRRSSPGRREFSLWTNSLPSSRRASHARDTWISLDVFEGDSGRTDRRRSRGGVFSPVSVTRAETVPMSTTKYRMMIFRDHIADWVSSIKGWFVDCAKKRKAGKKPEEEKDVEVGIAF
ncbi:MAG: hypothetical protein M1814_000880 [Vezdaea aestivalis]|nr:MAG: hypothetical protein M1814_000880 [Vezdaea aestivalis]